MRILDRLRSVSSRSQPAAVPREIAVDPSWRQWPTLHPGGTLHAEIGSQGVAQLAKVGNGRTSNGVHNPLVTAALLAREDTIDIYVAAQNVGHISVSAAPHLCHAISIVHQEGSPAACRAWITGPWRPVGFAKTTVTDLGLVLDLDPRHLPRQADCPFLPGGSSVSVMTSRLQQETLRRFLANRPRVVFTGQLREAQAETATGQIRCLTLVAAGATLGLLPATAADQYLPLVRSLHKDGLATSCQVTVEPDADRGTLDITLDVVPADFA